MAENYRKLMTDIKPLIHEIQKTPSTINTKKSRHIIVKIQKNKHESWKKLWGLHERNQDKIIVEFLSEIMQARRKWNRVLKMLK